MNTTQQHTLDVYRLARHGQPPPPPQGTHESRVLGALWQRLRMHRTSRRPAPLRPEQTGNCT